MSAKNPERVTRGVVELITAKRDGRRLEGAEIRDLIHKYAVGELPEEQMAAMAMAVYFQGLDADESGAWTDAMLRSGEILDLSDLVAAPRLLVDKHSTGGVGDKVSLILAPAAAACGVTVPMVSGRGLGHTGGTIDKLEAIPGYSADLDEAAFRVLLGQVGCAIIGQTGDIAPADKRLYALRDVTATVPSMPLIVSSIMSKKLAEGIGGLVLDVKVGAGAFMKTEADARQLAEGMIDVGERMGVKVIAFLTRMEEPLGRMVGNACEVAESLELLKGGGPTDLRELVCTLGGAMVEIAHGCDAEEGYRRIAQSLDDGSAMARFEAMVLGQGGDLSALPRAPSETPVRAKTAGFVTAIDAYEVAMCALALGAGRQVAGGTIDPVVGVRIDAARGEAVDAEGPVATLLHGDGPVDNAVVERLRAAFTVTSTQTDAAPTACPIVMDRLG